MIIDTSGLIEVDGVKYAYKVKPCYNNKWLKARLYNNGVCFSEHTIPKDADTNRAFYTSGSHYKIISKAIDRRDIRII